MGGYWGTIVVARPAGLLADVGAVAGFGHAHVWLRDLGGGWQMLETSGHDDPPDLREPCEAVVAETGNPALAAYVSDGFCAVMCAAVPGRAGPLTHLGDVGGPCGHYRHQPRDMAGPVSRVVDDVVAELVDWSSAAGLRADAGGLRGLLGRTGGPADDLVFELVKAIGVPRIGRTRPWAVPLFSEPFSGIVGGSGLAWLARSEARYREAMVRRGAAVEPAQPWEEAAIALETELWASLYRPGADASDLARRVSQIRAAYHGTPVRAYECLAVSEWEIEARRRADERATA